MIEWLQENSDFLIHESEDTLIQFAKLHSVPPPSYLRNKVLNKFKLLQMATASRQSINLNNLPSLSEDTNWLDWQEAVQDIHPPADFSNTYLHPLEKTEKRELYVVWVKGYIEEEVHTDLIESFIVLEGSCECHITDVMGNLRVVRMGQGDYLTMPLGESHSITITSLEPVKAILQWNNAA